MILLQSQNKYNYSRRKIKKLMKEQMILNRSKKSDTQRLSN